MRLRATLKIRNDHMIAARAARGWSQSELAAAAGVPVLTVLRLEALDYRNKNIEASALKIACALEIHSDLVLPLGHKQVRFETTHTRVSEVPLSRLVQTARKSGQMLIENCGMEDELASALKALPQRNRTVLELRYGLGEWGQAYTETETARILKISKTRVHQLERVGLRKLSHPRFSKILEGYLPSQEWKTLEAKDKIRADPP